MQMVAVAIAKATWNWVRGKCEEAMREVLGAGRGVQAGEVEIPAMAAEAGRETRQGAASDEESDGCDGAQDCNTTYYDTFLDQGSSSFTINLFGAV
tara:strand:- start:79 stop:366 length:288 start_codon:yes stop_codon:yes gene_type:complete